ncbi:MAG: hypothetical protein SF028_13590 [Candidatus Sumerlaeia bacterium]|nr:hypothetical protein [Candidatus Sumerlaeia bacterium]
MAARLLELFEAAFRGRPYLHRNSSIGDGVAAGLFEDLYTLKDRCARFRKEVDSGRAALNRQNRRVGARARRGDGTFGETVPGEELLRVDGSPIPRAPIASIQIGCEAKILAKAMIKQIDRVCGDLRNQVEQFRSSGDNPVTVAIVGVNHAEHYVSFEGERTFPTDGRRYKHPFQEADEATRRVRDHAGPVYDELLILPFRATNADPFPFEWVDAAATRREYSAALARICRRYAERA